MFRRILNRKYLYVIFPVVVLLVAANVCLILAKYGYFSSLADSICYRSTLYVSLDNVFSNSYASGDVSLSQNSSGSPILYKQNISLGGSPVSPPGLATFNNLPNGTYYATGTAVLFDSQRNIFKTCATMRPIKIVFGPQIQF